MEALLGLGSIADGSSNSSRHRRQCLLRGSRTAAQKAKAMGLGATPIQEAASGEQQNRSSSGIALSPRSLWRGGRRRDVRQSRVRARGEQRQRQQPQGSTPRQSSGARSCNTERARGPYIPRAMVGKWRRGRKRGRRWPSRRSDGGFNSVSNSCRDPPLCLSLSTLAKKFLYYLPAHRQNCTFGQSLRLAE
jgi:hypothetical protein